MNDDVRFYPNAIDKLIKSLDGEEAIIAGATCDDSGKLSYGGVIRTSHFKPSFKNIMSTETEKKYCDTFCANCVLIPTKIFIALPGMDQKYHHAMGDFDYGFEAVRKGNKILASKFFMGVCNDNSASNTWRDNKQSRKERLKKKESTKGLPFGEYYHYLLKNHGFLTAVVYSIVPYIKIILKV